MITKSLPAALAALAAVAFAASAQAAPNLIQNGSFTNSLYTSSNQFGTGYGGQGVTGWTGNGGFNIYYFAGTAFSTAIADQPNTQYGSPATLSAHPPSGDRQNLWAAPSTPDPDGGNFVGIDGDPVARGSISQTVNGLVVGQQYTLTFDWAADQIQSRTGATTEQLQVSLDGETHSTAVVSNASQSAQGWFTQSFTYTATAASETLTFLSVGTPSGLPPIALLDGVSLTQNVPEPSTLALLLGGLGGAGFLSRRRRAQKGA